LTSSGFDWDRVNDTELYQLCRRAGLLALPSFPREKLIALIEGLEEQEQIEHPIDAWRDAIMVFVNDFWPKLQSQLTCPAKTRDPKACYGCVDTQVYACIVGNEACEPYIRLRRKKTT
jgi:hypothetical protein